MELEVLEVLRHGAKTNTASQELATCGMGRIGMIGGVPDDRANSQTHVTAEECQ